MIELDQAQREALDRAEESPPRVRDPRTNDVYVMIHAALFERVRAILEAEDEIASIEEMYPLASEVLSSDEETGPAVGESA